MQVLREQQLKYEEESDHVAAAARLAELREAASAGDAEVPRASRLIARMYGIVENSLREVLAIPTRGMGGKYKGWLRKIPLDVAAVIAIRECIHQCSTFGAPCTAQNLATKIGGLYELEVRIREAEAVNPLYMQRIHEQVKDNCTKSQAHLRKLYNVAYTRVMKSEVDTKLSNSDMVQIGKFGIQACLDAGLIEQIRTSGTRGTLVTYELTPEVREFLFGYSNNDVQHVIDKSATLMVCPPEHWSTLYDGGYLSMRRKVASPLLNVRALRKSEWSRLSAEFTEEKMPEVFGAVNYLQSMPYHIHAPTLAAIRRLWGDGGGTLGVPSKHPPKRPEFPLGAEFDKGSATELELVQFNGWKRAVVRYYEEMREWRTSVRELGGFLRASERGGAVWFPMYLDKRGRMYYRGIPNPQGSDMAKAVLHSDMRKPLGNDGVFWLKVHIANSYGYDKERFQDRARWTEQHWDMIEKALDAPEDHPDVWGTDAPWCMYSAAWELREAYRSGNPRTYCTGIMVHMDATCSGLQHFSAMLRDPVGGQYVNLYDSLKCGPKQDIYAKVAASALESMQRDLESTDELVRVIAAWWIQRGIPRSLAKKPVMTYVYGATLQGTTEHIVDSIPDSEWPDPLLTHTYARYAAEKLFAGIAATVPAADFTMKWLRGVAKQQPRGVRMEWYAPTGFRVQHDYQGYDEVLVDIRSCGLKKVLVRNTNTDTRPLQMQNAISPNFVHALDAAHQCRVALRMRDAKLFMVGIHDSFGTHPCDVAKLHQFTREEFVRLYSQRNVLGDFLWDVGAVGSPPPRGDLNLDQVLDSEFFFC